MKRSGIRRKSKSPLAKLKDELWELCKELTRLRYGYICYTCGKYTQFPHTGHFITDSTCSTELSYDLKNLRPQCYACNIHKSGNWVEYERRLIRDHGKEYIEELKQRNEKTKGLQYDNLWYMAKIKEYSALKEELSTPRLVSQL